MSETNGAALTPPIEYPTITIPGRGTFPVKFDLLAEYTLDNELGMDASQLVQKMSQALPTERKDADGNVVERIPGRVSAAFMLKLLSACLWEHVHMTPEDLAKAFRLPDMPMIAITLNQALAKTEWSAETRLQGTATAQQPPTLN